MDWKFFIGGVVLGAAFAWLRTRQAAPSSQAAPHPGYGGGGGYGS